MSNSLFRLSPDDAIREGARQITHSGEFKSEVDKLYSIIDSLLQTGYTSPAARELYTKLQAKRPVLNGVIKTLNNYGVYMTTSGKATINADETVAEGVRV